MSKQIKDSQLHIRCTSQQKEDVKEILRRMGKTSDFIIEQFLNEYSDTTADLEIQQYFIEKELKSIDDEVYRLNQEAERLKVRYTAINNEINNKKLYDLSYHESNKELTKAINTIKGYVLQRGITNFNELTNDLFIQWDKTFKVHNVELIINVAKAEFNKWQDEMAEINANAKKENMNKIMQGIAVILNTDFKRQHKITDWNDYIESRNDYVESKAEKEGIHPVDLKLYLSRKNYDHKK